jgi:N-acetylmuramoyl-L-alanine amidase
VQIFRPGNQGKPVADIQDRLTSLGFSCAGDEPGVFEANTRTAVILFQQSKGLPSDGLVGPQTWNALVDASYGFGDRLLYHRVPMLRGDDVAELQRRLNAIGFDAGKVDGIFGPDTLAALLDFQRNRRMAEDGIAGRDVARELALIERATRKPGRESVRERQWLRELPRSVTGHRIAVDPACRDEAETAAAWEAAVAAAQAIQSIGGTPVLSRSEDTRPDDRARARRINRLGADIVLAFALPSSDSPGVYYFESAHSSSEAGALLAFETGARLALPVAGRSVSILRETRPPAILIITDGLGAAAGIGAVAGMEAVFIAERREPPPQPEPNSIR